MKKHPRTYPHTLTHPRPSTLTWLPYTRKGVNGASGASGAPHSRASRVQVEQVEQACEWLPEPHRASGTPSSASESRGMVIILE